MIQRNIIFRDAISGRTQNRKEPTYFVTFFVLVFSLMLVVSAQEQTQEQKISWYAVSETAMKTLLAKEKKRLEWEVELEAKNGQNAGRMATSRESRSQKWASRALNNPEEAQKWELEEAELSEKLGISFDRNMTTVRPKHGAEKEISEEEKEPENQNSVEYWWKRVAYYQRGAEYKKELKDAYLHVLEFRENTHLRE